MERTGPFPVHMHMTFSPDSGQRAQSMLTICVPLKEPERAGQINDWLNVMGNPASAEAREALLQSPCLHFSHMTAIASEDDAVPANLLVELNGDGTAKELVDSFVDCLWEVAPFQDIMGLALNLKKPKEKRVKAKLLKHNYALDISPFAGSERQTMGLNFFGLPEQSVPMIEEERDLARAAREHLADFSRKTLDQAPPARDAVTYMRRQVKHGNDNALASALVRPLGIDPAVSRHPTRELSETIDLYLKDGGFRLTVFGSMAAMVLAYFAFLLGGLPKQVGGAALLNLAANGVHILIALVLAYGLHWLRLRLFSPNAMEPARLWIWAVATLLIYLVVTPLGIWTERAVDMTSPDYWSRIHTMLGLGWKLIVAAVIGLLLWLALVGASLWYFRGLLKASEDAIPPEDNDLELEKYQAIMDRENQPDHAQNHIVFVTPLKDNPRWLRRVTMFIGFYFIKTLVSVSVPLRLRP